METQQLVPSVLLQSYKMFRTAVNNIDILRLNKLNQLYVSL